MNRRDLLLAAIEAASAYAVGADDGEQQQDLDGRQFSFRLRFCGSDGGSGPFRASFDETSRIRRIMVEPDIDADLPIIQSLGGSAPVAAEGFWVPRPWLLQAACPTRHAPPPAPDAEAAPANGSSRAPLTSAAAIAPTVGLVEFFDEASPRSARRDDRPYSVTRRVDANQTPGPVDLLIEGRLQKRPGGKVISCTGDGAAFQPTCLISIRLDQIRLAQPDGTELARWGSS